MNATQTYEQVWSNPAYRVVAPGEHHVMRFLELAKPDSTVIDFGTGTGRGAQLIKDLTGQRVIGVDCASNCLDSGLDIEFLQHDLTKPLPVKALYGFCTDMLEHVAPEDVDEVLTNILDAAETVYFAISTVPDHFGPALLGEPLHLTVQPHSWWLQKFLDWDCKVIWQDESEASACFLVSGWLRASWIEDRSELNCQEALIEDNIRRNLRLGLQEVAPHRPQPDHEVVILAGGPSLADDADEIYEKAKAGIPVVTVNGTYGWALERGILPAAQVMLDGRDFNRRFIGRILPNCAYLMSSQADHELVASLPKDQTWLWHSAESDLVKQVRDEIVDETGQPVEWYPVPGGTTVMMRAIPLLAMLGFRKFSIYGWDSCLRGDAHHAYSQPENDGGRIFEVMVGDRTFHCHGWMVVQANEFHRVVNRILSKVADLQLQIHGDGLLAALLADYARKGN